MKLNNSSVIKNSIPIWRAITLFAIGILTIISQIIDDSHPLYLIQSLMTAILVWSLFTKCRSAFILSLSMMFIAGNWLKLTIHKIFDYKYIEPTGIFAGTPTEWQDYHIYSIIITSVLLLATLLSGLSRKEARFENENIKYAPFLFHAAIFSTIILYPLNLILGIYRIGLGSKIELPLGLTAPISFLIFIGTPLIIALSADAHVERNRTISFRFVTYLSIAFIIASISTYSRAVFIIQMLPILIGMYVKSQNINYRNTNLIKILLPFLVAMVAGLTLVSAQRILQFSDSGIIDAASTEHYFNETKGLIIERWIGAESMMVAASTEGDFKLLTKMLLEDPKSGVFNLYHELSRSNYSFIDGKTFLNLPGYFAIIAFSGNFGIIFLGTLLCCAFGLLFERWVSEMFNSSETIRYTACVAIAYHFVQMAFPLLFIPYAIQMFAFISLLRMLVVFGKKRDYNLKL